MEWHPPEPPKLKRRLFSRAYAPRRVACSPAADFEWTTGKPRPRYMRYKALTSRRQEGTVKCTPKEWLGLPDGEVRAARRR